MNKIWIASVVVLFVALVGCKKEPVVPKSPEFIQAVAVPETVEYNGTSILNYEVINAEYVQINHVKYDSCKGSVEYKNLTANMTVTIVAFGEGTTSTTKSIDIAVGNPQAPTIKVTAPTDSIPYGDKVILSWTKGGVISSITVDGITQKSDTFTTPALCESKEYTIVATGPGGSETHKIVVLVGNWRNSIVGMLTYNKPFKIESYTVAIDGKIVDITLPVKEVENVSILYTIDGKKIITDLSGTTTLSWKLLKLNGVNYIEFYNPSLGIKMTYEIVLITSDKLTLGTETTWYGKPAQFQLNFYRP